MDHALALIAEIEHMELEKRTNQRLTLGGTYGENQKMVGITVSGNSREYLELHAWSR